VALVLFAAVLVLWWVSPEEFERHQYIIASSRNAFEVIRTAVFCALVAGDEDE
jgi:hypothetical protein